MNLSDMSTKEMVMPAIAELLEEALDDAIHNHLADTLLGPDLLDLEEGLLEVGVDVTPMSENSGLLVDVSAGDVRRKFYLLVGPAGRGT